jgi:hypothetical protein
MTAYRRRLPRWCALRLATVEQSSLTVSNGLEKMPTGRTRRRLPVYREVALRYPAVVTAPKLNGFTFS